MPLIKRMQHFAVEVADSDVSIAWYRDVLGFKLTERHAAYEVDKIPCRADVYAPERSAP